MCILQTDKEQKNKMRKNTLIVPKEDKKRKRKHEKIKSKANRKHLIYSNNKGEKINPNKS